ncbi:alpha/beta hydrolase [Paenibacillus aceti]|uniref:Peptidase S9 prolyl oligopeptidase catalytic domain-containing protein n=1 Tax=Paenibacillus aceti TaxID=1820010 RepID=A0ABQ1VQ99_9BACL|nr:alpha/beta fold hydrolase [Paenibacillus aceti]GGF86198.1 hypothetical protein GCM10010913_04560 [Paenibacillus aceti]
MNESVVLQKPSKPRKSRAKKIIIIIATVLVVLFIGLLIFIPYAIMPMFLGQHYEQQQFNSSDYGISSERITLVTDDSLSLAAWRTRAETETSKGTIIILSGIQNPSVTAFFGYAKMFADHGWDSLLIEMRARGESEGEEIGLGLTEWRDVKAGVEFLRADQEVKDLPIVALGTSMGGSTVITAAGELPEVSAVISISAFSSWSDVFIYNMEMNGMPKAISVMDTPFLNAYLGFHFGFNTLKYSAEKSIVKLGERPILMMHSTGDSQIPYEQFEKLLSKAKKHNIDVTTFVREGDEHFVCYEQYSENPAEDIEFSQAVLNFLAAKFP